MNLDKDFQVFVGGDKELIKEVVKLFKKVGRTAWRQEYVEGWVNSPSQVNYILCSDFKDKIEWNTILSSKPMVKVSVEQFRKAVLKRLSLKRQLKYANSKLSSIELILDDYYNGSYTAIGELAGEISAVMYGEDNE